MNESGTVEINQNYSFQENQSYKRLYESESNRCSKRSKCNIDEQCHTSSTSDTYHKSILITSDTDESAEDHSSDVEDFEDNNSNLSTDQSRYNPVILNQSQYLSRHFKSSIKQFQYIYEHSKRKPIEPTQSINDNNQKNLVRWELRNTFNRNDLFKEGYAVLSDESFPFYSLCYMCGSMGRDLIYCNNCCEAYHQACLNESECPRLCPTPESWLCPNCIVCNICGIVKDSSLITCSDCQRTFHMKCVKQTKDDQQIIHNTRNQIWFCPLCIKCDCGQALVSNEENLLSLTKSFSSQQSLMCSDCLNNMKRIRTNKTNQIEKCHLCEKFIEQFITKPKPLFSLTLIGNQSKSKVNNLLQCIKCKHRFHPKCDGYLNEDVILIPYIKNLSTNVICSKCDFNQKENIKKSLINYKIQVVKNTIASISSTLQIIISEEIRLNHMQNYMSNLQQLHLSRSHSLNLHAFINDLFIIVQRLLDNLDSRQWQAAINNSINTQCPWFKSTNLSLNNTTVYCSMINSSLNNFSILPNRCLSSPSIDHTYSLNSERLQFQSNSYKNNLLTSSDSLLRYINNANENKYSFENLYKIDTRLCQLCQTYADHYSSNISRLISIGINQWVHIGCILPAYTKSIDQSPYILRNIHETINRCQTKYKCELCFKMGASVQCYENDCNIRFHSQCIEMYYVKIHGDLKEKLNIVNGLFPNLTTLCLKHFRKKFKITDDEDHRTNSSIINNDVNPPKLKSINLSSTTYADLSNSLVEFSLTDIKLCIGSLQIKSLGNFDYLLDDDENVNIYPNKYLASRLFWSTKNARHKTIYHLHIDIEQTYHNNRLNHQTIEFPLSRKQMHLQQLYLTCEKYFDKFKQKKKLHSKIEKSSSLSIKCQTSKSMPRNIMRTKNRSNNENKSSSILSEENSHAMSIDSKTLRNLLINDSLKSTDHSRFALALVQALQNVHRSLTKIQQHEPIFSYYLSNSSTSKNSDLLLQNRNSNQKLNESILPGALSNNFKETSVPQIDGNIDIDDEDFLISRSLINYLIEQIENEQCQSNKICSKIENISSNELIHSYQQSLLSKFGRVKFTIISDDGYKIVGENLDEVWLTIVNLVRECRDDMNLTHLPMRNDELNGHKMFGLTKSIVKIMLNQLYLNSAHIERNHETIQLPLSSSNKNNSFGFIRKKNSNKKFSQVNSRLNIYQRKTPQRQKFNWLLNPNRRIEYALKSFEIDDALAYARQILLEKSSVSLRLYHLHYFAQRALIVGSSSIDGCGLFTLIDLVEGQMIIEYTGEVIRPCLTDKREHENERKGFGCYMFTVDSMNVIDATNQGNKARFINHNCQPNCFAKTIFSGGIKHIVIYALMNINRGSELTYDYSFPEEDIKIPCNCGTSKCRMYLN